MVMVIVPLWITTINLSRNVLMAAMSIPANGLMVKKSYRPWILESTFFGNVELAQAEKSP